MYVKADRLISIPVWRLMLVLSSKCLFGCSLKTWSSKFDWFYGSNCSASMLRRSQNASTKKEGKNTQNLTAQIKPLLRLLQKFSESLIF